MSRSAIGLALIEIICAMGWAAQAPAADLPMRRQRVAHEVMTRCQDRCGCFYTAYVHHRVLMSTYGAGFDPNNYDFTEPHYYYGPERAYPRYIRDPA